MKKEEMLNTLLNKYFSLRTLWNNTIDEENSLLENHSFERAELVHKNRIIYASECLTYEEIIDMLFDVDAFKLWLDS